MRKIVTKIKIGHLVLTMLFLLCGSRLFAQNQLLSIEVIGNRNNADYWTNSSVIADKGDNLRLSFILKARPAGFYSSLYYSPQKDIILNEDSLESEKIFPVNEVLTGKTAVRWYLIMPVNLDTVYVNHAGYVSPYAVIPYREILIEEWKDKTEISLSTLKNYDELFPGTIHLKVELYHDREFVSSAGSGDRLKIDNTIDYGGLSDKVFRISYRGRTGSKLLDNVLLYRNLPLIINPVSYTVRWQDHQTMQWIGGNLNSFIVAAAEPLGRPLSTYVDKLPLPEYNYFELTDYYLKDVILEGDYYTAGEEERVGLNDYIFTQSDFIVGRKRIALLYQDKSPTNSVKKGQPNELLDRFDLILECNTNSIRTRSIGEVFGDTLSLIRWKRRWPDY